MTTKIGIIGDVHAYSEPLEAALEILKKQGVDRILCTGDIAGYGNELAHCVELLIQYQCETVMGNHDLWHLQTMSTDERTYADTYLAGLPAALEFNIEDSSLYLVHARPPLANRHGIKLLDEKGVLIPEQVHNWTQQLQAFDFDVLIVGHSHQVYAEQLGEKQVINPGSTCFNHVCAILTLPQLQVEFLPLPDKIPLKTWNWGLEQAMLKK